MVTVSIHAWTKHPEVGPQFTKKGKHENPAISHFVQNHIYTDENGEKKQSFSLKAKSPGFLSVELTLANLTFCRSALSLIRGRGGALTDCKSSYTIQI